MANKRDYYEVLGVDKNATDEDIKRAYRRKAKECHPDLHPDDKEAEARFKAAMAEYEKKKNATTYAYLRRDLKRISADYREAQAGFEKLRTIDPDNKNYIKYLITIYSRLDRDDKAKQLKKLL